MSTRSGENAPGDGEGFDLGLDALRLPSLRRLIPQTPRIPGRRTGRSSPDPADAVLPVRDINDVIIDCALYVDGRRTGSVSMPDAFERARESGGFVWIGLREPNE